MVLSLTQSITVVNMHSHSEIKRADCTDSLGYQRGSASLYAIVLGTTVMLASSAIMLTVQSNQTASQETAFFVEVKEKAIECIEYTLPRQDWFYNSTQLGQLYEAQIPGLCGLPTNRNIQYELSNILTRDDISYRSLAFWVGPYSKVDATTFNRSTGELLLDPSAVSGDSASSYQIDKNKHLKTKELLREIERNHHARYNTLYAIAGDAGFNYFRASNCALATAGEIPCSETVVDSLSGWANINNISNRTIFADAGDISNAWGLPVHYCNSPECGASLVLPYSIVFTTQTPWGNPISNALRQNK